MKTLKLITTLFFVFNFKFVVAQITIDLPMINTIVYDDNNNFGFYHKTKDGNYQNIDIYFTTKNNTTNYEIEVSERKRNLEGILFKNDTLIDVNDIEKTNINNLLKANSFLFENPYYKDEETPTLNLLEDFSKGLVSFSRIGYQKKLNGGFGAYENSDDDDIEKWRINEVEFYNKVFINIAQNKQIVILIDGYANEETIFVPLKNKSILTFTDYKYKETVSSKINDYNKDAAAKLAMFEYEDFYALKKDTLSNSYNLLNNFGDNVFKTSFDTIQFNNYYIITKKDKDYTIYKSNLDKANIDNVKSAYLYRNGLDVLHDKNIQYYDFKGEKTVKFNAIDYLVCGTVNETLYELKPSKKKSYAHKIEVSSGSALAEKHITSSYYYIKNLTKKHTINFLDKSSYFSWDDNDSFTGSIYGFPNLLRVVKNNKVGIFSYDKEKARTLNLKKKKEYYITKSGDSILKPERLSLTKHKVLNVKEELPIQFDDIKQNTKDGLIYIYNNNKVGIFPNHKTAIYDSIEYASENYYKVIKNGKMGWLDIRTFDDFFD